MSILSDRDLRYRLAQGDLKIEPVSVGDIQPSSVDLVIHPLLKVATVDGFREHHLEDSPYLLIQGAFVLAATLARVVVPADLVAVLTGKSSLARQGVQVESAGYVDPGWDGELTLEIAHLSPIPYRLVAGQRIAQIRFETMTSSAERRYGDARLGSHYQHSAGPVEARL